MRDTDERLNDRRIVHWAVFYDDGIIKTSDGCDPEGIPADGVQWIVEVFSDGTKRYVHGMDYYLWNGEAWQGGNINDLERWLRFAMPRLKYGRWTKDSIYEHIRQLVRQYHDG